MATNLRMALRALTQNRLQALLTLLGMSVGIAMVVIVSGLGRGAQLRIESQIEAAGPTRIVIHAGNFTPSAIDSGGQQDSSGGEPSEGAYTGGTPGSGGDMMAASTDSAATDARKRMRAVARTHFRSPPTPLGAPEIALLRRLADVRSVAGSVDGNVSLDDDAHLPVYVARFSGFATDWPDMTDWKLLEGRWISDDEQAHAAPVALVTAKVGAQLWPGRSSPIGQTIAAGGRKIAVVGVIEAGGQGDAVVPTIHVPLGLAQALLHRSALDTITVRTTSVGVTAAVAKTARARLRSLHHLPDDMADDFRAETQSVSAMPGMGADPRLARAVHSNTAGFEQKSWEQMAKSLRQAGRTFTMLLAGAAGVSLLVGGIGIMNIMLVSVTARTREIGLRMALGARAGDVMVQFLVESMTLAALGGVFGLVLGLGGLLVTQYGFHWATSASPMMLVVALAMAALTGIVFGFVPARRAAFLDPVIALKAE